MREQGSVGITIDPRDRACSMDTPPGTLITRCDFSVRGKARPDETPDSASEGGNPNTNDWSGEAILIEANADA
jgi:hypothetical protein